MSAGSGNTPTGGRICQDCFEYLADAPLCICRATYDPCPGCGRTVFTTPREKQAGAIPLNCGACRERAS